MKILKWNELSIFKTRLIAVWRILFSEKREHWLLISMDKPNLRLFLQDKEFDVVLTYAGLHDYNQRQLIKKISNSIDPDDLILEKALFEAKALEKYGDQ